MEEYRGENKIILRGQTAEAPVRSHQNHGVDYYVVPLRVPRLSGANDVLNIVTADPDPALPSHEVSPRRGVFFPFERVIRRPSPVKAGRLLAQSPASRPV